MRPCRWQTDLKRVMLIGSGPIVIGQAAEFDYAGTQACRALKALGLKVILVNPNPATIMTDTAIADHIYIEPLSIEVLKRIIKKEKPDGLLSTMGGQSGLTLSMQLAREGLSGGRRACAFWARGSTPSTRPRTGCCSSRPCRRSASPASPPRS